jgi:cellulose synthase/poly-beta-1,6-N-acetylglucosamine synthase-like glycosyltransferase
LFPRKVNKELPSPLPAVSVIIAARNEEKTIGGRIENLLKQNYPKDKIEIIIVSDGSTDATNEIVGRYVAGLGAEASSDQEGSESLKLLALSENRGKPHALNLGMKEAKGDFVVFADARQQFKPDTLRELIGNFSDQEVGCVSGELVFYEDSDSSIKAEMGAYWDYEKWIRKKEAAVASVAGATGAIYAIRKKLYRAIPDDTLLDDVLIPMNIVLSGYRTIFDAKAIAYDIVSKDMAQEKNRKIRTLAGNWQLITRYRALWSPFANPIFLQFISHKVFRLLVPFFYVALTFSGLFTAGIIYKLVFIGCVGMLILPLMDRALKPIPVLGQISTMARAFVSLNYFAMLAFFYFFTGRKDMW